MTVNVYIWKSTISQAAGHAALEIISRRRNEYISWHPKDAPKIPSYRETFGEGVEAHLSDSYRSEVREKGNADYMIVLSKIDEDAMFNFWDTWRGKTSKFQLLKQNCSHIVSQVLMAGWLGTYKTDRGEIDEAAIKRELDQTRKSFTHNEIDDYFPEASRYEVWDPNAVGGSPLAKIARFAVGALGLLMAVNEKNHDGVRFAGLVLSAAAYMAPELDHIVWDSKSVSALAYLIKERTHDTD